MGHAKSAVIALIFSVLAVAVIVFAATQAITPSGNGPVVADGGTGRWTTYGSGSSAWGRIDDNSLVTGVSETTLNDTCSFEFDDFTLPAGATVSQISVDVTNCLFAGTSASMRVDNCSDATCTNGTAWSVAAPELGLGQDCDGAFQNQVFTTAPDGSSWDQTEVNNFRLRLIITAASGSPTVRVVEIDAVITYTVPPALGRGLNSVGSGASGQGWLHHQTIKTRLH